MPKTRRGSKSRSSSTRSSSRCTRTTTRSQSCQQPPSSGSALIPPPLVGDSPTVNSMVSTVGLSDSMSVSELLSLIRSEVNRSQLQNPSATPSIPVTSQIFPSQQSPGLASVVNVMCVVYLLRAFHAAYNYNYCV